MAIRSRPGGNRQDEVHMIGSPVTRRGLLAVAGAALAGSIGARRASAASRGVRFGVRTPLPKKSLHELALMLKEIGYDGIELSRDWYGQGQPVEELQKQLEGTGIAVSAIIGSIFLLDVDPAKRA